MLGMGQLIKPIFAVMTSLVLIFSFAALAFPPQEADANHAGCNITVTIFRGSTLLLTSDQNSFFDCPTGFNFDFNLNKRFERLFDRCFGSNPVINIDSDTGVSGITMMDCKGPFMITVSGSIDIEGGHGGSIIAVTVDAT